MTDGRTFAAPLALAVSALLLAGCGGMRVWPFRGDGSVDQSRGPENATRYRCAGGKSFYLRFLAGGEAWVILPDREIRLDKVDGAAGRRFSNGRSTLDMAGADTTETTLRDGSAAVFADCKPEAVP